MTEKQIEEKFIETLKDKLKYTYRSDICDRNSLERNFRDKFERLNHVHLSNSEFKRLLDEITSPDVFTSSRLLREKNTFMREDGTPLQYSLVNLKDWCKNDYEVINQLKINTRNSFQRYDVLLLINGLPLVQIELKNLDISPKRAIQQIVEYKNGPGNGYTNSLLCFMQIFIVSNRSVTYYFANNDSRHLQFNADEQYLPVYRWADKDNKPISHLEDFAEAFLSKCRLGKMISRYMVLVASTKKLLIMRPYQIYAVEAIMDCINENRGNGYIWHTTGSGKTLTSFKAATLLKENPDIDKCIFVVDRKDLDKHTRDEFNKFQDGCVEHNTNTASLTLRLLSEHYLDKIIVTTIQKLGLALNPKNDSYSKLLTLKGSRFVFIFDECHRSQFGVYHKTIRDFFPNSQFFGFTGTPISDRNATYTEITGEKASYRTTEDVFQKLLHSYTITEAIEDKNVLPFHIDYFKIDETGTYASEMQRKRAIVEKIIGIHHAVTADRRFNSIFATSSINDAIDYYNLFQTIQSENGSDLEQLNIACVFSPPAEGNIDIMQIQEDLDIEREDLKTDPDKKKQALERIIFDYNQNFGTAYSINEFDAYYQDIQQRVIKQEYTNKDYPHRNKIDILIVVDMLLTGFDAHYLNTLYVDKNLRYHNLIQAFSRTNRILNGTKPHGNILDFRNQQESVDNAIVLFSNKELADARKIWLVEPAENVFRKYISSVSGLRDFMLRNNLEFRADEVNNLKGDTVKAEFVNRFKEIQRFKTQLDQYTDYMNYIKPPSGNSDIVAENSTPYGFSEDDYMSFRGAYLDLAFSLEKKRSNKKEPVSDTIEDLDFDFVLFASALIDYDYIINLLERYANNQVSSEEAINIIRSSSNFAERNDIIDFVKNYGNNIGKTRHDIIANYNTFITHRDADQIKEIAKKYGLSDESLNLFVERIISRNIFDAMSLTELFAPLGLGWKERAVREPALMDDLIPILNRKAGGREIAGIAAYESQ